MELKPDLIEITAGVYIPRPSVFYARSSENSSILYTDEEKLYHVRTAFRKIEDKLCCNGDIIRVHRGHIIRKDCIRELKKDKNSAEIVLRKWCIPVLHKLDKDLANIETIPVSLDRIELLLPPPPGLPAQPAAKSIQLSLFPDLVPHG